MEENIYSVYARADKNGFVSHLFSTCFEQPLDTDILLESGSGDRFVHCQSRWTLYGENGTHNYKIVNGAMVESTEAEREAEREGFPIPKPTAEERLTAAEENINTLSEYSADLLYQVCLLQLGLTDEEL